METLVEENVYGIERCHKSYLY